MMRTRAALYLLLLLLMPSVSVGQSPVTFVGSGTGPFKGDFETGSVTATAAGPNLIPGGLGAITVNDTLTFQSDQIVSVTDTGNSGAIVTYNFTDTLFGQGDAFLLTSVGGESNITLEARVLGSAVDANWIVTDTVGAAIDFDDDGSGINATASGTRNNPGGVLLVTSVYGIDTLILSWTGNGTSNQGLVSGLVASPPTQLIVNGSFEIALDTGGAALPGVVDPNTGLARDAFGPPTPEDSIYVLNNGSTAVDGWVAASATLGATTDWVHSDNYVAGDGVRSMDLNGTPGPGGVAQFIEVRPGSRYRLEFDLAGNPRGLEDPDGDGPLTPPTSFEVTMEVDADGVATPFSFTVDTETPADPGWQRQSWELNSFDTELLLQFLSTTHPLYPGELIDFGPIIDNVSLVEVGVAGDYNGDGSVDAADYSVWRDTFGATDLVAFTGADGNGDGEVTIDDYDVWHDNYGAQFGASAADAVAIPEPSNALLIAMALLGGLRCRSRR